MTDTCDADEMEGTMKHIHSRIYALTMILAASTFLVGTVETTAADEIPAILVTPDKVETRIGTIQTDDMQPNSNRRQEAEPDAAGSHSRLRWPHCDYRPNPHESASLKQSNSHSLG